MDQPLILTLLLTYSCNLQCPFCGQNDIRKNKKETDCTRLSLHQVEKILDDAASCGIRNVNLWGGEPLLHPEIFDIIRAVKERYMRCFLVTNGTLLEKYAEKIIESRVDFLQLSIDAPAEGHDAVRNCPGLFRRIEAGVKKINALKRVFPIISSATVIFPGNVRELSALADSASDIGIGASFFQFLMSYTSETIEKYKCRLAEDYGFDYGNLRVIDYFEGEGLTEEEFSAAIQEGQKMKDKHGRKVTFPNILEQPEDYAYYNQTQGSFPPDKTKGCWSINYKINVQPNGDVVMCPDFPDFVVGNLFEQSIMEVWNCEKRRKFVDDFYSGNPLPVCYRCCQLWDKEDFGSWRGAK